MQLPPGHRTCSLISHFNSLGTIHPCCHHGAGNCSTAHKSQLSYQVPTSSWVERVHMWVKALPRGAVPQPIQPSRRSNLQSLTCKSRTLPLSHDTPNYAIFSFGIGSCFYFWWFSQTSQQKKPVDSQLGHFSTSPGYLLANYICNAGQHSHKHMH